MRLAEIVFFMVVVAFVTLGLTMSIFGGGGCSKPEEEKKAVMTNLQVQTSLIETIKNSHEFTIQPQLHEWLKALHVKGENAKNRRRLVRYRKKALRRMVNDSKKTLFDVLPGVVTN